MLAKDGIAINKVTCQCPMCVPSRNSMILGMYPSQLGVRTNGGGFFFEDRLHADPLPELMYKAGYQTAGFGKTHWNHGVLNSEPPTRGFEVRAEGQPTHSACYESGAIMMDKINPERPLFLYLSFIKPHAGYNVPKEFEDIYDINDIPDIPQPNWLEESGTHLEYLRKNYPHWKKDMMIGPQYGRNCHLQKGKGQPFDIGLIALGWTAILDKY